MNKKQRANFLNLIVALEESPAPKDFTMDLFANSCGTPACVLGHYGSRTDLQSLLKFIPNPYLDEDDQLEPYLLLFRRHPDQMMDYSGEAVQRHFGLTEEECSVLFSEYGCNSASTTGEAIRYLKMFLKRKDKEEKVLAFAKKCGVEVKVIHD